MSSDPTAAWIERGYWRIEGDLWCCPHCHAATPRPSEHDEWHDRNRTAIRRARNGPGLIR